MNSFVATEEILNEEKMDGAPFEKDSNVVILFSLMLETKTNGELSSHFQFDMDLLARSGVDTDKFAQELNGELLSAVASHVFELMAECVQ